MTIACTIVSRHWSCHHLLFAMFFLSTTAFSGLIDALLMYWSAGECPVIVVRMMDDKKVEKKSDETATPGQIMEPKI